MDMSIACLICYQFVRLSPYLLLTQTIIKMSTCMYICSFRKMQMEKMISHIYTRVRIDKLIALQHTKHIFVTNTVTIHTLPFSILTKRFEK